MTASIQLERTPQVQYLLRIADTHLILAQRLGEWCGHAPVLEEDIALANMALDLVGQSRALLTRAGELEGRGHDEDQLAFLRDERDYFNATLVELPRGDFAFTVLRNLFIASWGKQLWTHLLQSSDSETGRDRRQGGEGSALSPAARRRLGRAARRRHPGNRAAAWKPRWPRPGATPPSCSRTTRSTNWRASAASARAGSTCARPGSRISRRSSPKPAWRCRTPPGFRSTGSRGIHSEHMGRMLAEMQHLQRSYPGGVW